MSNDVKKRNAVLVFVCFGVFFSFLFVLFSMVRSIFSIMHLCRDTL